MLQLTPITQEHDLQEMQANFVEQLAVSYADQQIVKLVRVIPPRVRVAITLGILIAPWGMQWIRSWRKGE